MQEFMLKAWCAVTSRLHEIKTDERGATAVEYGIMVALIAAVIVVAVSTLGKQVLAAFTGVSKELPAAPAAPVP